jgi:hypothetical protein
VVVVLFIGGAQVPVYPLIEVVGNGAIIPPEQIGVTAVNVGITFGVTVIVRVVV